MESYIYKKRESKETHCVSLLSRFIHASVFISQAKLPEERATMLATCVCISKSVNPSSGS